jgi:hypothetical protein
MGGSWPIRALFILFALLARYVYCSIELYCAKARRKRITAKARKGCISETAPCTLAVICGYFALFGEKRKEACVGLEGGSVEVYKAGAGAKKYSIPDPTDDYEWKHTRLYFNTLLNPGNSHIKAEDCLLIAHCSLIAH